MSNFIKKSFTPLKKKIFTGLTWGVTVTTIVWSLGVLGLVVSPIQTSAAQDGDLIKMKDHPAVYWLLQGKRYVFPHFKTYFTWFADFSSVVTVSQSELQSYPIGGNVCQRQGTRWIKIDTDPKIYAVEPGCKLRWIPSEAVAMELYGANWNKRGDDVSDAFFVNYMASADLMSGEFPVGSLVQEEGSTTVYLVAENKVRRPLASEAVMSANRFKSGDVLKVAAGKTSAYSAGTSVTGKEDALANYGGFAGGTPTATGGTLSVKLAADTPAAGTAPKGVARLPFTYVDMTATGGDVVVDSLTVQRGGIAQDTVFADLTFLVDGAQGLAGPGLQWDVSLPGGAGRGLGPHRGHAARGGLGTGRPGSGGVAGDARHPALPLAGAAGQHGCTAGARDVLGQCHSSPIPLFQP